MTYKEALKRVNEMLEKRALDFFVIYKISFWLRIQEALEKQIPKKPKFANNIYKQKCYWCPSCNNYLMEHYSDDWFNKLQLEKMSKFNPYCHWCGQAIDWSDDNA